MATIRFFFAGSLLMIGAACSSPSSEPMASVAQKQISDIASMVQRSDGSFDVTCKSGAHEVATSTQIAQNQVCTGSTVRCRAES